MNAIEILKQDHLEVLNLIDELEIADEAWEEEEAQGADTFNRLHAALKLHTRLEEEIFYPALEQIGETRELVRDAYRDHEQVDELLAQLANLPPVDETFQELLIELRDSLDQHIEMEEGELFSKAEELCSATRLTEMGRQFELSKQQTSRRATATGKYR
jgi:iron-sulfur cluster repair protein YtfE (RIC family)